MYTVIFNILINIPAIFLYNLYGFPLSDYHEKLHNHNILKIWRFEDFKAF